MGASNRPTRVAVVGFGKIARVEHVPAILGNPAFALAATVERAGDGLPDVPNFHSFDELLASNVVFDAVALCTPTQVRHDLATRSIAHGKHLLLEKPPCSTLSQASILEQQAKSAGVAVYGGWHSRGAAGVAPAREWLKDRRINSVRITWREDVRMWHPGQTWIWHPGGLGVFDAGINSLAIATHILPNAIYLKTARLEVPANRQAPIAAQLSLSDTAGTIIDVDLDWRHTGPQTWDIVIETDAGTLTLARGGSYLTLPSGETVSPARENPGLYYPEVYANFARVLAARTVEVDVSPLRIVADAFLVGERQTVDAFID